ncbi:uncharacterized protein [Amphiura filiformis]|uniref:uncharacterized protein n=1 Tax=Amphiura filiformis TaxID=82378 RepID=UPI003B223F9C
MATTTPVTVTPQASGAAAGNTQMMQNTYAPQQQNVYMMPVPQQGNTTRIVRPVPGVQCLSIATIVIGGVVVILGIVAIVLKAQSSYIANPIWTGLLFLVTTGILGLFVHKKRHNLCMNIAFLVMSIISSIFAYQLMECLWIFAAAEWPWGCHPGPGLYYDGCTPYGARVAVSVVIGFCALAALVLCIISCSVTLYGTFTCCYNCCKCCRDGSQSTTMVQYSNHTGIVMTPVAGNGLQVMNMPQMMPQSVPGMQQQGQAGSKPMFIVATPPQAYLQNSPPAYASAPETFIVASTQPVSNPAHQSAPGNTQVTGNQDNNATAPSVTTSSGGQVAKNPENWQKF